MKRHSYIVLGFIGALSLVLMDNTDGLSYLVLLTIGGTCSSIVALSAQEMYNKFYN